MPLAAHIGQKNPDLAVLDPAGRATVLAGHPGRVAPFLEKSRFVDHQDRLISAQVGDHVLLQVIPHLISIPQCPAQQVLQAVRRCLTQGLGQLPAVLAFCRAQQPSQVAQRLLPRFRACEPPSDPLLNFLERLVPFLHQSPFRLHVALSIVSHR